MPSQRRNRPWEHNKYPSDCDRLALYIKMMREWRRWKSEQETQRKKENEHKIE